MYHLDWNLCKILTQEYVKFGLNQRIKYVWFIYVCAGVCANNISGHWIYEEYVKSGLKSMK